jgi:ABC-type sugar transport system ATPase subunit
MRVSISTPNSTTGPLLAMRGIRKSFGGVEVLKGVDFEARAGEVHALVGENGAGKSTLMNILAGVLRPDAGTLCFDGVERDGFASAHAARHAGVAMVFQERSLFAPLTVAENIFAGRQPVTPWGMIDRRRLHADAAALLAQVAPELTTEAIAGELSPAQQQMVEIAKALSLEARLIIFDEPTAALTETETARLFGVIRQLQRRGVAIVYISHRLEELFGLADRVTVLKDGAKQGTLPLAGTNTRDLVQLMVGRDVEPSHRSATHEDGPVLLEVRGLSDPDNMPGGHSLLRDIHLEARAGEIVGLAGLAGAGRTELALSLFGARPRGAGEVLLGNQPLTARSPAQAIAAGLGYVSEDRKESGLFLDMSVARNVAVARLRRFGSFFYRDREEAAVADEFRAQLRIASRSARQEVGRLSGGNQQKVLLARWLLVNPRVLIVDEPTRGVDVGAKAEVHALLYEFARQGGAVLVISSDLPEVLTVSDRIYVLRQGRVAGELARRDATEEAVMRLATLQLLN